MLLTIAIFSPIKFKCHLFHIKLQKNVQNQIEYVIVYIGCFSRYGLIPLGLGELT